MNNATNHSVKTVLWISSINFTLFNIIRNVLDFFFPKLTEGFIKILIITLVSELLYFAISFLVKLYINKHHIPSSLNKKFKLEGTWYHVHIPHFLNDIDGDRETLSCGKTIIRRDLYDFSLEAQNYAYGVVNNNVCIVDKTKYTSWQTVISEISDTNESDYDLIQIYKANTNVSPTLKLKECPCCRNKFIEPVTIKEADQVRYGIHKFKIDLNSKDNNLGYTHIITRYSDCWPSSKNGDLHLFRIEADRDAYILNYFNQQNHTR